MEKHIENVGKREDLLEKAKRIVTGARNDTYGKAEDSFASIAALWTAYLNEPIKSSDVAAMMILLKVARTHTSPAYMDSWIDIAGYAACGAAAANAKE